MELLENLIPVNAEEDWERLEPDFYERFQDDYRHFLKVSNGGYTRDGFFHFFGLRGNQHHSLALWNDTDLWKNDFGISEKIFAFAEDIFGNQYCFDFSGNRKVVKTLWISDGMLTACGHDFADFIETVVFANELNQELKELAEMFVKDKGSRVNQFCHIAYKVPVILGGDENSIHNMEELDSIANIKICGQISTQVKELGPKTRIKDIKMDINKMRIKLIPDQAHKKISLRDVYNKFMDLIR